MRLPTSRQRQHLLEAALASGVTHFDVARMYGLGQAEGEVGRFARRRRDTVTVATKFGIGLSRIAEVLGRFQAPARYMLERLPDLRGSVKRHDEMVIASRRYDGAMAQASLDKSLRKLGLDYVDFLFLHDPVPSDDVRSEELRDFFAQQQRAGKIRAWGVSQDRSTNLGLLSALGPAGVLQLRDNIFARHHEHRQRFTFGVLAGPYSDLSSALCQDQQLRRSWSDTLGDDPLSGDLLARLLVSDALAANPEGTVLYSTIKPDRLGTVVGLDVTPSRSQLAAFRSLVTPSPAVTALGARPAHPSA